MPIKHQTHAVNRMVVDLMFAHKGAATVTYKTHRV